MVNQNLDHRWKPFPVKLMIATGRYASQIRNSFNARGIKNARERELQRDWKILEEKTKLLPLEERKKLLKFLGSEELVDFLRVKEERSQVKYLTAQWEDSPLSQLINNTFDSSYSGTITAITMLLDGANYQQYKYYLQESIQKWENNVEDTKEKIGK